MYEKIRRSFRIWCNLITTNFANKAKYGENTTVEKIICDEGQRMIDREIN